MFPITCAVESRPSESLGSDGTAARPPVEGAQSNCLHRHGRVSRTGRFNAQLSRTAVAGRGGGDVLKCNCHVNKVRTFSYVDTCVSNDAQM